MYKYGNEEIILQINNLVSKRLDSMQYKNNKKIIKNERTLSTALLKSVGA